MRGHQTNPLEADGDIVFRQAAPGALCLNRGVVVGGFRLIFDRSLHQDLAQLLLFLGMAEGVSPEARLRAECLGRCVFRRCILAAAFGAVDEGRQPLIVSGILTPAIKTEIKAGAGGTVVVPIETHDMVILVFYPDAADEASFLALHQW